MVKQIKLLFIMFLSIMMISFSFAAVEVFSKYDTDVKINSNGTIEIHKEINLQNIHTVGIVPGNIEFKISKKVNNSDSEMKISNIKLIDRYGNPIKYKLVETNDYNIISFEVFSPLLPGFEYKFSLDYVLEYESSGVFFKSLEIPVKEATNVPIREGTFKLTIPQNYAFTYLSYNNNSKLESNTVTWELTENMPNSIAFEYSYLPLKFGGVRGSVLFWMIIDAVLFLLLILELRKQIKKRRETIEE